MTVISMSRKEIYRMSVLRDLDERRITVSEAAMLMHLTRRHVFHLAKAFRARGPEALVSRRRGQPSNRRERGFAHPDRRMDRAADPPGTLRIHDFGDEVHLWFEQRVPWPIALEILRELKGGLLGRWTSPETVRTAIDVPSPGCLSVVSMYR